MSNKMAAPAVPTSAIFELIELLSKLSCKTEASDSERLGFYPIGATRGQQESYKRMQKLDSGFWLASEIDYSSDEANFDKLAPAEQELLKKVMAIFAVGDGAIIDSLLLPLILTCKTNEDEMFYIAQMHNEQVHAQTYGDMIKAVIKDANEEAKVLRYPDTIEPLKRVMKFLDDLKFAKSYKDLFVANAMAEFVVFSSLFAVIFWFRAYRPGMMKGIVGANELIAKDECLHAKQSCEKYLELSEDEKYTDEEIHQKVNDLIIILDDFIDEILDDSLPELTPENLKTYVRFIADMLLEELGHSILYDAKNPLMYMRLQDMSIKTNFFEDEVNSYTRASIEDEDIELVFD